MSQGGKNAQLPTFPIRIPGLPGKKPVDIVISRPILYWMIIITVLLLGETIYLVKKNHEASKSTMINPPPIIRSDTQYRQ